MKGYAACARCGVPLPVYGPELCTTCQAAAGTLPLDASRSPLSRRRLATTGRRVR